MISEAKFRQAQRVYDNMVPDEDDEPCLDKDGNEVENPCKGCRGCKGGCSECPL